MPPRNANSNAWARYLQTTPRGPASIFAPPPPPTSDIRGNAWWPAQTGSTPTTTLVSVSSQPSVSAILLEIPLLRLAFWSAPTTTTLTLEPGSEYVSRSAPIFGMLMMSPTLVSRNARSPTRPMALTRPTDVWLCAPKVSSLKMIQGCVYSTAHRVPSPTQTCGSASRIARPLPTSTAKISTTLAWKRAHRIQIITPITSRGSVFQNALFQSQLLLILSRAGASSPVPSPSSPMPTT